MPRPAELDYERITGSEEMQADAREEARVADKARDLDALDLLTRSQVYLARCQSYVKAYQQRNPEGRAITQTLMDDLEVLIYDLQTFRKGSPAYKRVAA